MPILQGDYDDFETSGRELISREDPAVDTYRTETVGSTVTGTNTINLLVTNPTLGLDLISEADAPVEIGDRIEITGNSADDGFYTIATVGAQAVTVEEALAGGTGGTAKFVHKMGAKRTGFKHASIAGDNSYEALIDSSKFFKTIATNQTPNPDASITADVIKTLLNLISSDGTISLDLNDTTKTVDITTGTGLGVFADQSFSDAQIVTASGVYVDMPTSELTISEDGTYWVSFMCDLESAQSKPTSIVINANGIDIAHSERIIEQPGGKKQAFSTQGITQALFAGDVVKMRWMVEQGNVKSYKRSIVALKVEP